MQSLLEEVKLSSEMGYPFQEAITASTARHAKARSAHSRPLEGVLGRHAGRKRPWGSRRHPDGQGQGLIEFVVKLFYLGVD